MTRQTRDMRRRQTKIPALKQAKVAAKPAQIQPVCESMDYATRVAKTGTGVPRRPKYVGEKPLREVAAAKAEAKKNRTVELLNQNGYVSDANGIAKRNAAQKSKAVFTKNARKQVLSRRRDERQLDAIAAEFDAEVEATWGQEEGEFDTLAAREMHEKRVEAGKKGAVTRKENQAKRDQEYEQWYCETAFNGKSK